MNEIEIIRDENEKLKKVASDKSELISITAHQLRTSLSALKWTLQMFINRDLGEINSEQEDYLKKVIEGNDKAISLVNYLLTFNKTDDTSTVINFTKINIVKIIENIILTFSGESKNKNISINFIKPETNIPEIKCDEKMIIYVLQNLVENAIKYSSNNTDIKIDLKYKETSNEVEISIHDNGIGIKEDDQTKIFSKFFRTQNAIETDRTGSGLGLFTSKNIIDKHNGKIWFESSKDSGTTFFVVLPTL